VDPRLPLAAALAGPAGGGYGGALVPAPRLFPLQLTITVLGSGAFLAGLKSCWARLPVLGGGGYRPCCGIAGPTLPLAQGDAGPWSGGLDQAWPPRPRTTRHWARERHHPESPAALAIRLSHRWPPADGLSLRGVRAGCFNGEILQQRQLRADRCAQATAFAPARTDGGCCSCYIQFMQARLGRACGGITVRTTASGRNVINAGTADAAMPIRHQDRFYTGRARCAASCCSLRTAGPLTRGVPRTSRSAGGLRSAFLARGSLACRAHPWWRGCAPAAGRHRSRQRALGHTQLHWQPKLTAPESGRFPTGSWWLHPGKL